MKKYTLILLFFILALGFIARLYHFSGPVADWHSWRQADTSAVSRNFVKEGFDLLHPRFDDLSNVPSGIDNPNGYRFVEFPIYNLAQAGFYKLFGIFTLEEWGRLTTIFSSLLTTVFIFLLVKRYTDSAVALGAAAFYALVPFNIYYGRTILPDPMMVTAIIGGIYFFDLWIQELIKGKSRSLTAVYCLLALLLTASALLLKPYALFFTLPMIAVSYNAFGLRFIRKWQLWAFLILSILPLGLWRIWMLQFPEGIPLSAWLFNEGNIRFKGAFFYWIFAQRIGGLILGFWGAPFLILGLLLTSKSEKAFSYLKGQRLIFLSFLVSSLTYVTVIARGNVQHDYYQILIIPTIAIFVGLGIKFFLSPPKEYINRSVSILILVICAVFAFAFRWYAIRDFFNINNPSIITAGKAVDRLTPKDAKVIANYNGDTSFLYQTNRQGWASFEHDLPVMVKMGADYMVLVNPSVYDLDKAKEYKVIEKTNGYIIFNLRESP